MANLLSCTALEKSFGGRPLFSGIAMNISEGERIGVLGPNGAGKSTLLKILAGIEDADSGDIIRKKGLRFAYLPQEESFNPAHTVHEIWHARLLTENISEDERWGRIGEVRSIIGLQDIEQTAGKLSGGWRKRVAIAEQLILHPELLILDEPTNHLDLEGITWLENFIIHASCAVVIISHDRTLLENATSRIYEINRVYPQGYFTTEGNYSKFLEKREEYLLGVQRYEESLRGKVRREIEWLRRGAKARTTKAKGRIHQAEKLIGELAEYQSRSKQQGTADIEFSSSGRKTKKLVQLDKVSKSFGSAKLFNKVTLTLSPGIRVGLVGANGSGKSTLLKIIDGSLSPDSGTVELAPQLRIVKFDQSRAALDRDLTLKRALTTEGDSVIYRDREIHVASWAKRFLFRSEQLQMPVRSLSGGEQARLLIAKLILEPADVLLLDEPTNDLDIDTLQVLEESLEEFPGAVVLVTHDRFMLDRVSTTILGLHRGQAEFFASYSQWEQALSEEETPVTVKERVPSSSSPKKGLAFKEQKELASLERQIEKVEKKIAGLKEDLLQPDLANNVQRLREVCEEIHQSEQTLAGFIERWSELEAKRS